MKLALTATGTKSLTIGKPPIFVILCILLWTTALIVAFTHPGATYSADGVPVIGGP